ncbi:hypothetical protein OSB04_028442 [Centaurea solstitialis]|uniref:Myb/SANT-like domain-containing protein n=1 Tax=Centaurea solstitialis TaxID=347529 RepID=A0AA38SU21_9ASTR|nr:hypothetical protein OSB04_028442 [Centaurea solstitialis]
MMSSDHKSTKTPKHTEFSMEPVCVYSQPKKPRIYWRKEIVVKTFLEACIQEIALNGREGGSLKPVSWKNVAETLKRTHNFIVEQRQMKNQYDYLKGKYGAWSKLKNKAGDVYDPLTNTFNLTEEEWQIEMKSNKYIQRLRSAPLPFPELCLQLFDGVVCTRVGTSTLSNPSPLAFRMIEDHPANRTEESCDSTQDPLASARECSSRLQTQIKKRKVYKLNLTSSTAACTIRTAQIEESHRPTDEHRLQQDEHQEVMVQKLDVDAHPPSRDPDSVPVGSRESSNTGRSYARCLGSSYSDEVQRLKKQIERMEQAHEQERLEMKVREAVIQAREAEMEAREANMQAREAMMDERVAETQTMRRELLERIKALEETVFARFPPSDPPPNSSWEDDDDLIDDALIDRQLRFAPVMTELIRLVIEGMSNPRPNKKRSRAKRDGTRGGGGTAACTIPTAQIEESHRPTDEHQLQQDAHHEVMVQKLDVDAHPPSRDPDLVPVGSPESSTGRSYAPCLGSPYSGGSNDRVTALLAELNTLNASFMENHQKVLEIRKERQRRKDFKLYLTPHGHLTGGSLATMLQMKEEIRQKYGWKPLD